MEADLPDAGARHLVIAGYGASGARLARLWRENGGGPVIGLCRHPENHSNKVPGLELLAVDLDAPQGEPPAIDGETVVVWLAPPPREGDRDSRLASGLPWLLADRQPQRLVYVSTTGVYGAAEGWVNEAVPVAPDTDRGCRRVDAERQISRIGSELGIETVRLRVAGIYGPGRLPERRLREGAPLDPELAERPGNRIHEADLARALYLAALRGGNDAVYNVADGSPSSFGDYLDACADYLGLARLTRAAVDRRDPAADFLRAGRRIDAGRLREELGLVLLYPDYQTGLAAGMAGAERESR